MNRDRALGCALMFTAAALLGGSFTATKVVGGTLPVSLALEIRFLAGILVLTPIWLLSERREAAVGWSVWRLLLLQSLVGVIGLNVLLFAGLARTTASAAGVIFASAPIMVAVLSWLVLRERITLLGGVAAVLATVGMAQLTAGSHVPGGGGLDPLWGNVAIFAAVMCSAVYSVLGKRLTGRLSPVGIAARICLICGVFVLPFAVHDASGIEVMRIPSHVWVLTGAWGLLTGAGYSLLLYAGLARVTASTAGVFGAVSPLAAVALSAILLGETITASHIVGSACAILGVLLVSMRRPAWRGAEAEMAMGAAVAKA